MHAESYVFNFHNYHVPQKRKLTKGKKVFSKNGNISKKPIDFLFSLCIMIMETFPNSIMLSIINKHCRRLVL